MAKLLTPLNLGALDLCHRAVFPGAGWSPDGALHPPSAPLAYGRQASPGGLVITRRLAARATFRRAHWPATVAAVHATGGFILAQLPLPDRIDDCRQAAEDARQAGFDGVEIAVPEDRTALGLGALDAVIADWAAERVGLRLTPPGASQGHSPSPLAATEAVLREVNEREVAFVHLAGAGACPGPDLYGVAGARRLRAAIAWPMLVSGPFTPASALAAVELRWADAVGFETAEDGPALLAALRGAASSQDR
ncbi:beta/alpha barrel domain-containing protein [Falsiroseomonas tokyonensis]|uniref:Uncharacterized protein n=1 Tax=Falsiroseomonas tokyonensis TaxID=430521 RepID=A0ABV7BNZ2_9PROT|nr:hypothetical protein [Falsiroseomonas tokyonensis]MBU8537332.1 hypothetical protein [Falsiroseomonas tokyonensis]